MKEEEINLDGEKVKVVTKLPEKDIEDNNIKRLLDDTIDLTKLLEEQDDDK